MENIELKLQQLNSSTTNTNTSISYHTIPVEKIAQYDINGYIIKIYNNLKEMEKDGFNPTQVKMCLDGRQKTHKNFIFKTLKNEKQPLIKINTQKYKPNIVSRKNTNEYVSNIINRIKPVEIAFKITKSNSARIGSFLKNGKLVDVFLSSNDINNNSKYTRSIYDHIYNRVGKKGKKQGYKNKYFFKKLNVGETYYIGRKYDLNSFDEVYGTSQISDLNNNNKQNILEQKESKLYTPKFPKRNKTENLVDNNSQKNNEVKISLWGRLKILFTGNV